MGKNYLPFANRAIFRMLAGGVSTPAYVERPVGFGAMDIGIQLESRAILQDLCIFGISNEEQGAYIDPGQIGIKLGWLGQGYLMQRHMPLDVMQDGSYELYRSWTFPRPYRLFSKEQLKVRMRSINEDGRPIYINDGGVTFNGVRTATQEPIIMHDGLVYPPEKKLETYVFDDSHLRAPYDSDVDLHSVSFGNCPQDTFRQGFGMGYQVEGPGRRNWFKADSQDQNLVAGIALENLWWVAPIGSLINLGEEDGWFMHQGQTLLVDVRNWSGVPFTLVVTLRGSLEVDDDRI